MTIKNGDLPAVPSNIDAQTLACVGRMDSMEDYYRQQAGLTKREYFAMTAMQGLLVNAERNSLSFDTVHTQAVKCADNLLEELERTK